jgi:hypothetical protein
LETLDVDGSYRVDRRGFIGNTAPYRSPRNTNDESGRRRTRAPANAVAAPSKTHSYRSIRRDQKEGETFSTLLLLSLCVSIRLTVPWTAANVFTQILWWLASAGEALLLVRSIQGKFFSKYRTFYYYVSAVLVLELLRFGVFTFHGSFYRTFYWYTQFLAAAVGYAVIVEIYWQTLKSYPGAARVVRGLLLIIFAAVMLKVVVAELGNSTWSPSTASAQLERNMRTVQAVLLLGIIIPLAYYVIPIGRNLKGIILGYSFYVCASVLSLAFGSQPEYGPKPGWRFVQPIAYLLALLIWCVALWSHQPNPKPETESTIERDYKLIAEHTRRMLSRAASFLKMGSGEL